MAEGKDASRVSLRGAVLVDWADDPREIFGAEPLVELCLGLCHFLTPHSIILFARAFQPSYLREMATAVVTVGRI